MNQEDELFDSVARFAAMFPGFMHSVEVLKDANARLTAAKGAEQRVALAKAEIDTANKEAERIKADAVAKYAEAMDKAQKDAALVMTQAEQRKKQMWVDGTTDLEARQKQLEQAIAAREATNKSLEQQTEDLIKGRDAARAERAAVESMLTQAKTELAALRNKLAAA